MKDSIYAALLQMNTIDKADNGPLLVGPELYKEILKMPEAERGSVGMDHFNGIRVITNYLLPPYFYRRLKSDFWLTHSWEKLITPPEPSK